MSKSNLVAIIAIAYVVIVLSAVTVYLPPANAQDNSSSSTGMSGGNKARMNMTGMSMGNSSMPMTNNASHH
jgi:hypothetical protein